MKKRLPVNTKRVLFDRQRTFGPKSVEPVLIEFGVAAYGKLSVWESDNWLQNADGHGIVPEGFHWKIGGDAQFTCTVLLANRVRGEL